MVVEYWGRKPVRRRTSPGSTRPTRTRRSTTPPGSTYDYQYEGAGNWPFNTAYAATYRASRAIVTRLHSLDEVERFIAAGIPVVTSQSFLASELDGANYGTSGHLFVIVGFTADR